MFRELRLIMNTIDWEAARFYKVLAVGYYNKQLVTTRKLQQVLVPKSLKASNTVCALYYTEVDIFKCHCRVSVYATESSEKV